MLTAARRHPRNARHQRPSSLSLVVSAFAFFVVSTLAGCVPGVAAPQTLPDEYLGQWYYLGSSGGIGGDGMGDEATGWIVIDADNTIDSFGDDGSLIGSSRFDPFQARSIFSAEEVWHLNSGGGFSQVILISDDGENMSLSENVYDGFSLGYARSR